MLSTAVGKYLGTTEEGVRRSGQGPGCSSWLMANLIMERSRCHLGEATTLETQPHGEGSYSSTCKETVSPFALLAHMQPPPHRRRPFILTSWLTSTSVAMYICISPVSYSHLGTSARFYYHDPGLGPLALCRKLRFPLHFIPTPRPV